MSWDPLRGNGGDSWPWDGDGLVAKKLRSGSKVNKKHASKHLTSLLTCSPNQFAIRWAELLDLCFSFGDFKDPLEHGIHCG